jgi:hypothetical protein
MPAQNFAACATINEHFLVESGRIGPDAYNRGRETDPIWLGLIPQKAWHDNMGLLVNNTIYERSGLTTAPTWNNMTTSTGSDQGACFPPLVTISNATTEASYGRQWIALESDPLCLMDLVVSNEPRRAVQGFVDNLMQNAIYVRKERLRSEYERVAAHKIIVAPGLPEDSAAFPLVQPTSPITAGVLRTLYPRIQRDADNTTGATKVAKGSRGDQKFIFISSQETIENVVKNDSNIRDDFRWSSRVDELLGSWSAARIAYGGFIMCQELYPPRYNWNGSDFTRVPEYAGSATTIGTKLTVNPAWNNAQFEVSYIFHPDVMINRVPNQNQKFGEVTYGPLNYTLDFRWINKYDRNCNPDEIIGFFRAVGIYATEPVFTDLGYAILGLRCTVALDLVPCASNSGYNSSSSVWSGADSSLQ